MVPTVISCQQRRKNIVLQSEVIFLFTKFVPCDEPVLHVRLVYFVFIIIWIPLVLCLRESITNLIKICTCSMKNLLTIFPSPNILDAKQATIDASSLNIGTCKNKWNLSTHLRINLENKVLSKEIKRNKFKLTSG